MPAQGERAAASQGEVQEEKTPTLKKREVMPARGPLKRKCRREVTEVARRRQEWITLKKMFQATPEDAETIGTAGVPAGALAMRLLSHGTSTDIYVWAKAPKTGSWTLYGREAGKKPRKKELFVKLEDAHYEFLRPRADVTDLPEYQSTLKLWRESAFAYPATGLYMSLDCL